MFSALTFWDSVEAQNRLFVSWSDSYKSCFWFRRLSDVTLMLRHYQSLSVAWCLVCFRYVEAKSDRVTVIFSTVFKDDDDIVIGKVFMQVIVKIVVYSAQLLECENCSFYLVYIQLHIQPCLLSTHRCQLMSVHCENVPNLERVGWKDYWYQNPVSMATWKGRLKSFECMECKVEADAVSLLQQSVSWHHFCNRLIYLSVCVFCVSPLLLLHCLSLPCVVWSVPDDMQWWICSSVQCDSESISD